MSRRVRHPGFEWIRSVEFLGTHFDIIDGVAAGAIFFDHAIELQGRFGAVRDKTPSSGARETGEDGGARVVLQRT